MNISIEMTEDDFERLTKTSMKWQGLPWAAQDGRFENCSSGATTDAAPDYKWRMAYWVGDSWLNVILARSYLRAAGEDCEVLWDMVENPECSYVILTNYVTETWKKVLA